MSWHKSNSSLLQYGCLASVSTLRSDQSLCSTSTDTSTHTPSHTHTFSHTHTHTHTHTHSSVTLSYSHTVVPKQMYTVHSHSSLRLNTHPLLSHTHEHTPPWQIWHSPPAVTVLQPPPPSVGAIPVTVGCARCGEVLKSRRLFPVNLLPLLYVVVQMFWGEVCRRWRVAMYNSSQRAVVGGAGRRRRKARLVILQVTGHASHMLHFVLITFTYSKSVPHFHKTLKTLTQTRGVNQDAMCVFLRFPTVLQ